MSAPEPGSQPALLVDDVCVADASGVHIVDQVTLSIDPGEILGLVGESGSGKTTLALALMRHWRRGLHDAGGRALLSELDLSAAPRKAVQQARGRRITYLPQSPASALNPALRIRTQLRECIQEQDRDAVLHPMLLDLALPVSAEFLDRYPHQLSGGQQQRVLMAMALMNHPDLIILDEPTTGLDMSTQKEVLTTIRRMCALHHCAALYISHDIAAVAEISQRLAVMYAGKIIETGPTARLTRRPMHPYTARLLMAVPDHLGRREIVGIPGRAPSPRQRPPGCPFAPRCDFADARCRNSFPKAEAVAGSRQLVWCFHPGSQQLHAVARERPALRQTTGPALGIRELSASYGPSQVLDHINLTIAPGQCTVLIGASGSGKTTLCRSIAGLHPYDGEVRLDDVPLARSSRRRSREHRRQLQYIFQDPYSSLNPRKPVRELILEPAKVLIGRPNNAEHTVAQALEQVGLPTALANRHPHELSAGERQRVAIARALVVRPSLLICDEVTSSLDASVTSAIIRLLRELQTAMGLTLLFATHDISLAWYLAQSVAVLHDSRILEQGDIGQVLENSPNAYTRTLLADTPKLTAWR